MKLMMQLYAENLRKLLQINQQSREEDPDLNIIMAQLMKENYWNCSKQEAKKLRVTTDTFNV